MAALIVSGAVTAQEAETAVSSTVSSITVLQATVTSQPTQTLLPFETLQLTTEAVEGLNETELELFAFGDTKSDEQSTSPLTRRTQACKVYPGDDLWPLEIVWKLFDIVLGGALLKPLPKARVCWGDSYDEAACNAISANWTNSYSQ